METLTAMFDYIWEYIKEQDASVKFIVAIVCIALLIIIVTGCITFFSAKSYYTKIKYVALNDKNDLLTEKLNALQEEFVSLQATHTDLSKKYEDMQQKYKKYDLNYAMDIVDNEDPFAIDDAIASLVTHK